MLNVLIGTDSRGFLSKDNSNKTEPSWVSVLEERNKNISLTKFVWNKGRISTLFHHLINIRNCNKKFDVIILQCGYHEYVYLWPLRVFEKGKLQGLDPNPTLHLKKIAANKFRYRNDKLVYKCIKEIKKYTKNLLLLGIHCPFQNNLNSILMMNYVYGKDTNYLNLPIHNTWRNKHTFDGIHYNSDGTIYICKFIERYIARLSLNICDILSKNYE